MGLNLWCRKDVWVGMIIIDVKGAEKPEYPRLHRSVSGSDIVVLFSSLRTGIEVEGTNVGEYSTEWPPCTSLRAWEPLPVGSEVNLLPICGLVLRVEA